MKLTLKDFKTICADFHLQVPETVLDSIYVKIFELESGTENPTQKLIAFYCEEFKAAYGTAPMISRMASGQARTIVRDMGLERSKSLLKTYLEMRDPYFLSRMHDLGTFTQNLNKIVVKHETGKALSHGEIRQIDKRQTNANAFAPLLEKARNEPSD